MWPGPQGHGDQLQQRGQPGQAPAPLSPLLYGKSRAVSRPGRGFQASPQSHTCRKGLARDTEPASQVRLALGTQGAPDPHPLLARSLEVSHGLPGSRGDLSSIHSWLPDLRVAWSFLPKARGPWSPETQRLGVTPPGCLLDLGESSGHTALTGGHRGRGSSPPLVWGGTVCDGPRPVPFLVLLTMTLCVALARHPGGRVRTWGRGWAHREAALPHTLTRWGGSGGASSRPHLSPHTDLTSQKCADDNKARARPESPGSRVTGRTPVRRDNGWVGGVLTVNAPSAPKQRGHRPPQASPPNRGLLQASPTGG